MILLNFKTYPESSGPGAVKLIEAINRVAQETGLEIMPAVQALDFGGLKPLSQVGLWLQHLDSIEPGRHTGQLSPYTASQLGAVGCQINHSENPVELDIIEQTIKLCQPYGLKTLVFCDSVTLVEQVTVLKPDYICWENPAQVGTGQIDFAQQQAEIRSAVEICQQPFLLGAGVSSAVDVKLALSLGAKGVGLASAFVKASDPYQLLLSLAQPFKG